MEEEGIAARDSRALKTTYLNFCRLNWLEMVRAASPPKASSGSPASRVAERVQQRWMGSGAERRAARYVFCHLTRMQTSPTETQTTAGAMCESWPMLRPAEVRNGRRR